VVGSAGGLLVGLDGTEICAYYVGRGVAVRCGRLDEWFTFQVGRAALVVPKSMAQMPVPVPISSTFWTSSLIGAR
jgi:hypothetical protein